MDRPRSGKDGYLTPDEIAFGLPRVEAWLNMTLTGAYATYSGTIASGDGLKTVTLTGRSTACAAETAASRTATTTAPMWPTPTRLTTTTIPSGGG